MKTLLLLRHAKSSKDDTSLRDVGRPLNERGEEDAQLIGKYIRKQKIRPNLVISSPAERARQTAKSRVRRVVRSIDRRSTQFAHRLARLRRTRRREMEQSASWGGTTEMASSAERTSTRLMARSNHQARGQLATRASLGCASSLLFHENQSHEPRRHGSIITIASYRDVNEMRI